MSIILAPLSETRNSELSREVAYALMGYLNAYKAGLPLNARFEPLRNQAFDQAVLDSLSRYGFDTADDPVFIQSFEGMHL